MGNHPDKTLTSPRPRPCPARDLTCHGGFSTLQADCGRGSRWAACELPSGCWWLSSVRSGCWAGGRRSVRADGGHCRRCRTHSLRRSSADPASGRAKGAAGRACCSPGGWRAVGRVRRRGPSTVRPLTGLADRGHHPGTGSSTGPTAPGVGLEADAGLVRTALVEALAVVEGGVRAATIRRGLVLRVFLHRRVDEHRVFVVAESTKKSWAGVITQFALDRSASTSSPRNSGGRAIEPGQADRCRRLGEPSVSPLSSPAATKGRVGRANARA